jgi:hypothetical protein
MAVMVLVAALAHAQAPAIDLKPTFISPTPGLYVNGWPSFTISYPKEWVEEPFIAPGCVFSAGAAWPDIPPGAHLPMLTTAVGPSPLPLEDWAKIMMPFYQQQGTDIKVLSDKPSQLKDGTPAREIRIEYVATGSKGMGAGKRNILHFVTKKDVTWVDVALSTAEEKVGEDLERIAHSLTFQPDREKPVQVPPDVRAFLDMYCTDIVSHDVKAIMEHYSDRFLHSGASKLVMEQALRHNPGSAIQRGVISYEPTVTVFEPRGDKAYIDGFWLSKAKGDARAVKTPMYYKQIINEHGQWKWFGNQK